VRQTTYRGRRAAQIENEFLRVTVLHGGGHIAEITDKRTGVNPLWTPGWDSVEPDAFGAAHHGVFGAGVDGQLLAAIMGHSLCLDIFGGPSDAEARAGLTAHGEGSISPYVITLDDGELVMRADFPLATLRFERRIHLRGRAVRIRETVENLSACDRPVGWTQHVTLGPPFLEGGRTQFRASATRSRVFEQQFGVDDYLVQGADFDWPMAPGTGGAPVDLRVFSALNQSSGYTAHLMDPRADTAFFSAYAPASRLAFGYVWRRADFPWMGIWEENRSRTGSPWNGTSITRGMEFGVSPFPESRRAMIDRGRLFETPTYRWLPAREPVSVEYWAVLAETESVPEDADVLLART
jgi:hypothetical protein